MRIDLVTHVRPPPPQGLSRKFGRVMINPDTHPALVRDQVINPVGNHLAQLLIAEVVHVDAFGPPTQLPFTATVAEWPDEFLFLGIHRHDRLALPVERFDPPADVLKLRNPIRMVTAFESLPSGLEAIP